MGLSQEILKAIGELGFISPTPVQEQCIPFIQTSTQDLIANAQTGTGKTAAFGLPILERIDKHNRNVQALVLSPTRELGVQIANDLKDYSKFMPEINVIAVYGGASIDNQVKELQRGGQIVVGTPGRIVDLIKRRKLKVENINYLVLDEADEMLSMGFKDELDEILSNTPSSRQTLLFSATMPNGIESISKNYMNSPKHIAIGKKNSGAVNVSHVFYQVHAKDRYLALKRIVDVNPGIYGIIFVRTRFDAKEVAEKLMHDGYNADALHGDLSQPQREYVMTRFRSRNLQILVATDVAARGLDVDDLTHVINYNIPDDVEVYVHRSGRTGRAGKSGISISIIHSRELNKIKMLERMVDKKFQHLFIPAGKEVCEKQLFHLLDKMENVEVDESQINPFLKDVYQKLEFLSREDLIKRFVSVEFNRFLEYYSDAEDINVKASKYEKEDDTRGSNRKESRKKSQSTRNSDNFESNFRESESGDSRKQDQKKYRKNFDYSRFYINVGTKNGINPGKLINIITKNPDFKSVEIGEIELFSKFSFFEIDKKFESQVFEFLENSDYQGLPIKVELTKGNPQSIQKEKPEAPRRRSEDRKFGPKSSESNRGDFKSRSSSRSGSSFSSKSDDFGKKSPRSGGSKYSDNRASRAPGKRRKD